jgi:hypothetical protein
MIVKGDSKPFSALLVIDENDWVSERVGAEDNQGGFVWWHNFNAMGSDVLKAG